MSWAELSWVDCCMGKFKFVLGIVTNPLRLSQRKFVKKIYLNSDFVAQKKTKNISKSFIISHWVDIVTLFLTISVNGNCMSVLQVCGCSKQQSNIPSHNHACVNGTKRQYYDDNNIIWVKFHDTNSWCLNIDDVGFLCAIFCWFI